MRKVLLAGLVLVGPLFATESRVVGLGGNVDLLFDDDALVERYPSLLSQFAPSGVLELRTLGDLTSGAPTGYAKLFGAKEGYAHGVYVNYPTVSLFGLTAYGLRYAGAFGDETRFGYAVDLGLQSTTTEDDANPANKTTQNLYFFGLTLAASGQNFDAALNVGFPMYKNRFKSGNTFTDTSSSKPQIQANARYFMERSETSKMIFALNFGLFDQRYTEKTDTSSRDVDNQKATTVGFLVGANTMPVENVLFVGGLSAGYTAYTAHTACTVFDPNANKCSVVDLSAVAGVEGHLTGSLTARVAAMKNLLTFGSLEGPDNNNNNTPDLKGTLISQSPISYVLGISYEVRNVKLDATVSPALLYNGPYFLTGTPSSFVNILSVLVNF